MPRIFCVIPAFNEEAHIEAVVRSVMPTVDRVIVVDDGSSDKTSFLAAEAGATVLKHPINRGQGAALETGNRYSLREGADLIVHFDADGQFLADEIKDVIRPIAAGEADAVFGSRFLGKKSDMPMVKRNLIMPIARIVNRVFFGVRLSDPQSGFRALSRPAAEAIRIENDGMAHCSEIMAKAVSTGQKIAEVPITVSYAEYGQKFSGGVKILKDLALTRLLK